MSFLRVFLAAVVSFTMVSCGSVSENSSGELSAEELEAEMEADLANASSTTGKCYATIVDRDNTSIKIRGAAVDVSIFYEDGENEAYTLHNTIRTNKFVYWNTNKVSNKADKGLVIEEFTVKKTGYEDWSLAENLSDYGYEDHSAEAADGYVRVDDGSSCPFGRNMQIYMKGKKD